MRSHIIRSLILPGLLFPVLASAATTINLSTGWNLVGNGDSTVIDVATRLGDSSKITTVWKWNKTTSKWAFYAPSMTTSALASYAESKGYEVLTSIASKEGFWVNAASAVVLTDSMATPPIVGAPAVTLLESDLAQGWNLVGSADGKTPSQLNAGLTSSLNAAGKAVSTAWAWDASSSKWRFYAPTLAAQGGTALSDYILSKGYLAFTSALTVTDGFWMNIGAVTPGGGSGSTTTPVASASLSSLTFTSASDWQLRIMSGTAAQNTPDADNTYRYRETRTARSVGGAPYSWGPGSSPRRGSDLHWNGSSWASCSVNFENTSTVRDANGNNTYNYCDKLETGTSSILATSDVSGRPMIDVYNEVIAASYSNWIVASAPTVLGATTFPASSKLTYQTGTSLTRAIAYYPGTDNYVYQPDAAVAAGNTTACNANPFPSDSPTATLAGLIATIKGTPCVYMAKTVTGANGIVLSSGTRNEAWGSTTLSLGTIGTAPTNLVASSATTYYTGNTRLRVAFGSGNVANYYSCQETFGGSTRNCDSIGSGTYTIETKGDAKTLSFAGLPALASSLDFTRVFVERGGHVYYGYQSTLQTSTSARLNLVGLNALFSQLGLPAFDPNTPIALTVASYAGSYNGTFTGTDSGTFSTSIGTSGVTTCSGTSVLGGAFTCNFTVTPSASDTTTAAITLGVTGNGAVFTGTINFYTGVVSGNWVNSAYSGTFAGSRF
ncbi:MAG: hypothetical protein Q8R67_06315 [Rhodoferax sp.]|nr:hypothetical protein [Rhodoferax sp.]MDP3651279.1 hypothetical protein [Rhodoferax sp.]